MAMTAESLRAPMLYVIDIKNGLMQQPIRPQLMKGDKKANTIIVRVMDGSEAVDLTGVTATGSFISPVDGAEIPLEGSVDGNEARVVLVDECYAEDGYFEANVKLTAGETSRTILSITGQVLSKGSGAVIDIGSVIPSIDDIIEQYATMKQVTKDVQDAADKANDAASRAPYVGDNGNWFVWNAETSEYVDSGSKAQGPTGPQGPAGANGTGSGTVTAVTVSGTKYEPDGTGNVDLGELGGGEGTVTSVCGVAPDEEGNVALDHTDVGALASDPREADETDPEMSAVPINADQLSGFSLADIMLKLYPVGSVYTSTVETSPAELFGGTWEQLKDRFLLGAGDSYAAGSVGGEAAVSLTDPAQNAPHDHAIAGQVDVDSSEGVAAKVAEGSTHTFYFRLDESKETRTSGGGQSHNNMPPYLAVYMWKRVS